MKKTNTRNDFSRISPTAKLTAYWKSFSDIPYSKEIAESVDAEKTAKELTGNRPKEVEACAPAAMEVRYKAIDYGLKKRGISNVMELACGLSPRGLGIVGDGGIYVGTDLPDMLAESSLVIPAIARRIGIPMENFHLQPVNVLQEKELKDASIHFGGKTFAICNEGLLPYLTMEEKTIMAKNIRNLLKDNGGCWITTDLTFKEIGEKILSMLNSGEEKTLQESVQNISKHTGSNLTSNDFSNKAAALKFYNNLGFDVEEFPMYSGNYKLSTVSLIPDRFREPLIHTFASVMAWILTPKA